MHAVFVRPKGRRLTDSQSLRDEKTPAKSAVAVKIYISVFFLPQQIVGRGVFSAVNTISDN